MRRLLVIDDDADIRAVMEDVLCAEGYEVETAANGLEALRLLETGPLPDLILLDLMMPVMNGWDFRIRQMESPRLSRIPVVVLSASRDVGSPAALLGAQGSLRKPLSLEALLDAIGRYAAPPSP